MELILERGLVHQQNAIEAITGVFANANVIKPVMPWQNKGFIFSIIALKAFCSLLKRCASSIITNGLVAAIAFNGL